MTTIEIIQIIMSLIILAMVFYLIKTYDELIEKIKTDYYSKGYADGSEFVTKMISDFNKKLSVDKNEES